MVELLVLGVVIAGTYFLLKAIWNYEIALTKAAKK